MAEAMEISEIVKLAKDVPDREVIRIVDIEGMDVQACGGTHVKKTSEIGSIKMTKAQNRGKQTGGYTSSWWMVNDLCISWNCSAEPE